MTKQEAMRQTQQENTLRSLGFTVEEAEQLRRISMTLHRWHELECGNDNGHASYCVVRGKMNGHGFEYDDDGNAYMEIHPYSGKTHYTRIPDRETGAKARLRRIVETCNGRRNDNGEGGLITYIQGDPRGAALYILRPGDVLEGKTADSYYTRGICVY